MCINHWYFNIHYRCLEDIADFCRNVADVLDLASKGIEKFTCKIILGRILAFQFLPTFILLVSCLNELTFLMKMCQLTVFYSNSLVRFAFSSLIHKLNMVQTSF